MRIGYSTWGYHVYAQQTQSRLSPGLIWSEVGKAGFKGVELSQPLDELPSPDECRRQLERHGLRAVAHWVNVGFDPRCLDEAEQKARFLRGVGGSVLVCEGEKQTSPLSREQRAALYRQFEAVGRVSEGHGIRAAFHFHRGCLETEAEVHDVLAHTRAVWFAPDLGHAAALGWDPLPVIREHRDKVVHVHLKDAWCDPATGAFIRFVEFGRGNCGLDIKGCLDYLEGTAFPGWAMVEQDHTTTTPMCDALAGRQFLEQIGYWKP
jgi:inosose dehydratase